MPKLIFKVSLFCEVLLCFATLLNMGSVIAVFFPYQLEFATFFLAILVAVWNQHFSIPKRIFSIVGIIFLLLFILSILTLSSLKDYLIIYERIIICLLIIMVFHNNMLRMKSALIISLWIIMYLAIINFFLSNFCPNLFSLHQLNDGYKTLTLGYLFNMYSQIEIAGIEIYRNQSIFWEPGILQIAAIILVYYVLFEKNANVRQAAIPILVLLSTISTTGYILLMFLLLVKFKNVFTLKRTKDVVRVIGITCFIMLFIPLLISEVNNKFSGDAKGSSTLRIYDALSGINVFLRHPITGIGMNNEKYLQLIGDNSVVIDGEVLQIERGNTNSIILLLTKLGVISGLMFLYGLYRQNLFIHKKIFFILLLISLCSEPIWLSIFILIFPLSSLYQGRYYEN